MKHLPNKIYFIICSFISITMLNASSIPNQINYQGSLLDNNGNDYNGSVSMEVKIYDAQSGGNIVFQESVGSVEVHNGLYSFQFGNAGNSLRSATEKIADGNSSATSFSYTVSNYPIINPSVIVTDGNNTWTDAGATNVSFSTTVNHANGSITVDYQTTAPATGVSINVSYNYLESGIYGALIDSNQSWVELTINGSTLSPRQRLITVPFAMLARTAIEMEKESITLDMLGSSVRNRLSPRGIAEFTSTATWTVPENVDRIYVEIWGAGGGGGSSSNVGANYWDDGGGGGSGGYVRAILNVIPEENLEMIVGIGGAKSVHPEQYATGSDGNATVINSQIKGILLSAAGGTGGGVNTSTKRAVPGVGGTGVIYHGSGITRQGNSGLSRSRSPGGAIGGSIGSYGAGGQGANNNVSQIGNYSTNGSNGYIYIEW